MNEIESFYFIILIFILGFVAGGESMLFLIKRKIKKALGTKVF